MNTFSVSARLMRRALPCACGVLAWAVSAQLAPVLAAEAPSAASTFAGLQVRDIGPALTSGRITDFAMHPQGWQQFYVATAAGGLWKTNNAGITWAPLFDNEGSYSIGVVELDPHNPNVVWVGSGENNSQRSVAYGDGVYKSVDGGQSWQNMGLKQSEHIGKISIDPRDSDVVYVAAQGPLWNEGGERGVYKTSDGGQSWKRVLDVDKDTGANEVIIHPQQPDLLIASTYQRRRHVWTLINGGPGSGIYRSTDAGANWQRVDAGLPPNDMGRIGLAYAPSAPNIVYAVIETDDEHEGTYRSTDFGASWEKRSGYSAGSPQYYNELIVDPHNPDRVYAMDTFMQVSEDGGKSWNRVGVEHKHVDEHALWIDPANTDHLITGNDGGIYESWDRGSNWRHMNNLPIAQFYRVTPDNDFPFYNVYGGTQDNSSLGGPSRTTARHGIANEDWVITLGGDGFKTQIDPSNPDTVYAQLQHGLLARFDRQSYERVYITPMPASGETNYKWNWNSAFIISPHQPQRLYFAAEKIFRSDDGGDSWRAYSPDLTRQLDRNQLKVMGRVWSVDAVAKNDSTSFYGSIISLAESPQQEGLVYAGTDDGLIQVSANDGQSWTRYDQFGKVPEMSYVSDIAASSHDANVVYASFDNHKRGDFKPYLLRSNDRGKSWSSIAGDLPERGTVYTVVEDHVDPQLLFVGTEFGVYFTQDGGTHWAKLSGNMPTVAVRDLEIQRRESDLVIGTFGRGIRILDDYSPLRTQASQLGQDEATLFQVKDPWLYVEDNVWVYGSKGFAGAGYYTAPNPDFGAIFSYYLRDGYQSLKDSRRKAEREKEKAGQDTPYPSWDALRAEAAEDKPSIIFTIRDAQGREVRSFTAPASKGFHRVAWNLRGPDPSPIDLSAGGFRAPWDSESTGPLIAAGDYSVSMAKRVGGVTTALGQPQRFSVKTLERGQFRPRDPAAQQADIAQANELVRATAAAQSSLSELNNRIAHVQAALLQTNDSPADLAQRVDQVKARLRALEVQLNGDNVVAGANEPTAMSISARVGLFQAAHWDAMAAVTANQRQSLAIARQELTPVISGLATALQEIQAIEAQLGTAPWTPGRLPQL